MPESSSPSHPALAFASLALGASTVLAAQVIGAGLNYGAQLLFARWAGPAAYGAYSYAMAWAALLSTMSGVGLPQALTRFIPEYYGTAQWSFLRGVVRRSEQVVLAVSSGVAVLGLVLILVLVEDSMLRLTLILGMALIPPLALLRLQTEMCVARQQVRMAYVFPRLLRPLVMMGGAAVLVLGWGAPLTAPAAALLAGAPVVPIWWAQRWHFHRGLPAALRQHVARYATGHWVRTAFPMLLITGFLLLLAQTDLLMIGLLIDPQHVGVYKVAAKTASLVLFPLLAVNAVMAPRFAEAHTSGDEQALQRLASAAAHWIFWPALVGALALAALSGIVLGLFGPSFLQGEPVLWILVVAQLANAGSGSVGPLLNMTGHQQASARVYGLCAGGNVVLNAIGIYYLGIIGAAIATTLSTALWNVSLYRLVVQRLGIYPSVLDAWRVSRRVTR